jgi:hypothetical protein
MNEPIEDDDDKCVLCGEVLPWGDVNCAQFCESCEEELTARGRAKVPPPGWKPPDGMVIRPRRPKGGPSND